jgi:UDP-glucose 4-epimerase
MHVFVTGGAGFIGGWVCTALIGEGHQVTVFDTVPSENQAVHSIVGDLRDKDLLLLSLIGHDAVIHLAAKTLVPESVEQPQLYFDVNLVGGQNLLEAMRSLGIKKIVYSSTAAVYGSPVKVPIEEDDPKFPINPYGATKYAFEHCLHAYHKCYGIDVTMFRYFNPFGPDEDHEPETHAVPNFIKATLEDRPIPLYWNGEQERDFFYVGDLAEAHVMGLHQNGFHTYNLGSGTSIKIIDLVHAIFQIIEHETEIQDLGVRAGDPPRLMANIDKVKRELGWEPKMPLMEGLEKTVEYFRSRMKARKHETVPPRKCCGG